MSDQKPKQTSGKRWFTVELPGHAVWEVEAASKVDAREAFIVEYQINTTDRKYAIHDGRVKEKIDDKNKAASKVRQKVGA